MAKTPQRIRDLRHQKRENADKKIADFMVKEKQLRPTQRPQSQGMGVLDEARLY